MSKAYPLDHVLWAAPDLEGGNAIFEALSGVAPGGGGSHDGFGTRNTLAALGRELYFEVISVDPAQPERRARAGRIAELTAPEIHTFGVAGSDLDTYRDNARQLGLKASDPVPMQRMRADGVLVKWRAIYVDDPQWGDMVPFLIDWMGSEHPWKTAPEGCRLIEFTALHPEADALRAIYRELRIDVHVKRAPAAGFLSRLDTPKGEVVLT